MWSRTKILLLPMVVCIASPSGCANRASVQQCGDLWIRNNAITPYGLVIIDCERAEEVARRVAGGRDIIVEIDDCVLLGSGDAARYLCAGDPTPRSGNVVGKGGRPVRDDAYRIPGVIRVRGDHHLVDYQQALVDAGAATVSNGAR